MQSKSVSYHRNEDLALSAIYADHLLTAFSSSVDYLLINALVCLATLPGLREAGELLTIGDGFLKHSFFLLFLSVQFYRELIIAAYDGEIELAGCGIRIECYGASAGVWKLADSASYK
jgi:hypothetical protein